MSTGLIPSDSIDVARSTLLIPGSERTVDVDGTIGAANEHLPIGGKADDAVILGRRIVDCGGLQFPRFNRGER